MLGMVHAALST
uniref:Uncharacterized protein n=1 Tax=Arundo donax TaxID=35708 RepID=A0A0A9AVJ4_ARUDO